MKGIFRSGKLIGFFKLIENFVSTGLFFCIQCDSLIMHPFKLFNSSRKLINQHIRTHTQSLISKTLYKNPTKVYHVRFNIKRSQQLVDPLLMSVSRSVFDMFSPNFNNQSHDRPVNVHKAWHIFELNPKVNLSLDDWTSEGIRLNRCFN